jgi:hypothetical protein
LIHITSGTGRTKPKDIHDLTLPFLDFRMLSSSRNAQERYQILAHVQMKGHHHPTVILPSALYFILSQKVHRDTGTLNSWYLEVMVFTTMHHTYI